VTEADTSASRGSHRLVTAVLPVGCVAVVFAGLRLLLAWPEAPGWVGGLSGTEADPLRVAVLAVLLLWMGVAPAWVGVGLLRKPAWGLGLPVWAGLVGVTFLAMLRVSAAAGHWDEPWSEQSGRLLLALSYLALVLVLGGAVVGAATRLSWARALPCMVLLLLTALPWIVLGHVILSRWGIGEGAAGLVRRRPLDGHTFLVVLVFLVAVNGAALGHALRRPRVRCIVGWLAATAVLVGPGWFLLRLGLAPEVVEGDVVHPAVGLLLAADRHADLASSALFFRWAAAQGGLVLTLALGHLCALRFVRETPVEPTEESAAGAKPSTHPGRAYLVLAVVYGVLVVYGSLVPLDFRPRPFEEALEAFARTPYLALGIRNRADLVANLLLFVPLTFAAMGAMTRENTSGARWVPAAVVAVGAVILSLGIEFSQLYFLPRTVSLNDILAECVGGAIGIGAWLLAGDRFTKWWRRLAARGRPRRRAIHLLTGYVVALVLYQLFPFDLILSADEMSVKLQQGKLTLLPLADLQRVPLAVLVGKAVIWVPVGYWIVIRWSRVRRPVLAALGGGMVFTAAIELLQMFVYSRYASSTDIVLGVLGAGMGGVLAGRFGPAARRPWPRGALWTLLSWGFRLGAAGAVAAALVWGKWSPLAFHWPEGGLAQAFGRTLQVPFFYQYWNAEFDAFAQILRDVAVPATLGLLLMAVLAPPVGWRRLAAAVIAGTVSAGAELGQVFFPPHTADMTTAVLAAAGGAVGTFLYTPFVETFVRPGPALEGDSHTGDGV